MVSFSSSKECLPKQASEGLPNEVSERETLGGRLLNLYYCFGEYDGVVIFEAPDAITCMGAILAAIAPGHLRSTKTTVLFTMDEAMEAMGKAGAMVYAGPKG